MDGRVCYCPECADIDLTFDPNALFSPELTPRGSGAFRLGEAAAAVVWKAILEKQDMKIELEREKVEAAKMEAHAATMKATNEATRLSLTKMSQESKILMDDMEKMDPLARAWHEMYRECIGQEVLTVRAALTSMTPPTPSTFMNPPASSTFMPPPAPSMFMPPPATVDQVPALELPPGLADDEDVIEVEAPMTMFI
ncbi:hypothetical protein QYE76_008992 [Lolium multiflorum]|uniref:Uncharacterized protein n=1 Tax=Lolium multiflorum TaxID=4521 RepID=A0AAD8TUD9_LOLMU|nr:hypothetical protein QYE76_008992 [Lolium multiflorum]